MINLSYKLSADKLNEFLQKISESAELFIPKKVNNKWKFKKYKEENVEELPKNIIHESVKNLFFPKRRPIATFETNKKYSLKPVEPSAEKRIIFGLKPCDVQGLTYMDKVFIEGEYKDQLYEAERDRTTLIGITCDEMGPHCHCTDRHSAPDNSEGMDIHVTKTKEGFIFQVLTEKGKHTLDSMELERTDNKPAEREWKKGTYSIASPDDFLTMYHDDFWFEKSDICLTCGACTFECPTCVCFLISDEKFKDKGERVTVWDTCQFRAYSRMAGGHNPRNNKSERLKNRTMDKFYYSHKKYGKISCVGCGRCVIVCPLKRSFPQLASDITKRIKQKNTQQQASESS